MPDIPSPHLGVDVELTDEREAHIQLRHADLLPRHRGLLLQTIADPDIVHSTPRFGDARVFTRWFPDLFGGKHIVAVVLADAHSGRHWLVTAYISRKLVRGEAEWQRS